MTEPKQETVELRSDLIVRQAKLIATALREGGMDLDGFNPRGRAMMGAGLIVVAATGLHCDVGKEKFLSLAAWAWDMAEETHGQEGEGAGAEEAPDAGEREEGAAGPSVADGGGAAEVGEGAEGDRGNPA